MTNQQCVYSKLPQYFNAFSKMLTDHTSALITSNKLLSGLQIFGNIKLFYLPPFENASFMEHGMYNETQSDHRIKADIVGVCHPWYALLMLDVS